MPIGVDVPDTFLSKAEIFSLTNRITRPSQAKALNSMGISHRVRPDGSIAILRAHITKIFDGEPTANKRGTKPIEPNFDFFREQHNVQRTETK
jgi:Domain of unknown function (DUF4224)